MGTHKHLTCFLTNFKTSCFIFEGINKICLVILQKNELRKLFWLCFYRKALYKFHLTPKTSELNSPAPSVFPFVETNILFYDKKIWDKFYFGTCSDFGLLGGIRGDVWFHTFLHFFQHFTFHFQSLTMDALNNFGCLPFLWLTQSKRTEKNSEYELAYISLYNSFKEKIDRETTKGRACFYLYQGNEWPKRIYFISATKYAAIIYGMMIISSENFRQLSPQITVE